MDTDTPLVLLHAFPLSRVMYYDLVAELEPAGRSLIVPDLRGFGAAPLGEAAPSVDLMADDIAALLDGQDAKPAIVAGLSMGGYVTMALLRRRPDLVAGVILLDTKASADAAEARDNRLRMAESVARQGPRVLRPMLDSLLGETTRRDRPDVVAKVTGWLDAARPEGVAWAQRAMAARPESFDTLRDASVPGAVIVGTEDVLSTHDDALAMASAFDPPVPVHVIPDAGHLTAVEAPAAVAGAVQDALTRLGAG